jgi:hypothetical protein
LTDNICVWMIQDEKIQKETFSPGRAIGNFGIKINLGYLMYLYADVARKEPETIKNIRNHKEYQKRIFSQAPCSFLQSPSNKRQMSKSY